MKGKILLLIVLLFLLVSCVPEEGTPQPPPEVVFRTGKGEWSEEESRALLETLYPNAFSGAERQHLKFSDCWVKSVSTQYHEGDTYMDIVYRLENNRCVAHILIYVWENNDFIIGNLGGIYGMISYSFQNLQNPPTETERSLRSKLSDGAYLCPERLETGRYYLELISREISP